MFRLGSVLLAALIVSSLLGVDAWAGRGQSRGPVSPRGYSYRSYSYEPQDNRPLAVRRAPYTVQSNIWRADRKMLQTYWYRETWRP